MESTLSPVFSNIAKAFEKQHLAREAELAASISLHFGELEAAVTVGGDPVAGTLADLAALFAADEASFFGQVRESAQVVADRGALRMATWGSKVNAIQKAVADRYAKKGEALLDGVSVYVCEACGYIAIAAEAPEICPVCKAPALRFTEIK